MNWEMLKGALERAATVLATFLVARGYIPAALSADLVLLIVAAGSVGFGLWVNRQAALVQAAASMPQVAKVVVDDSKLARETTRPGATVTTNVLFVCLALGAALTLGACTPQTTGEGPKTPAVRNAVSTVQDYTRKACGFVPAAATVNALFVRNDIASDVIGLASQICAAVQQNPMTEGPGGGRTVPKLKGVPIKGHFVR